MTTVAIKAYSEFSNNVSHSFSDASLPLKVASGALSIIAIDAGVNGDFVPMLTSTAFALGNLSVAGAYGKAKEKLTNAFGKVAGQIATQAETFYTAGLGLAAYMAAGESNVALPFIDANIPTSMLTFIPTAIGGGLAVRNATTEGDNKSKPFLWITAGVGVTAGVGILGGAILPGLANGAFAGAYIRIQSDIEGGYKNLVTSIKQNVQNLFKRAL